MNDTKTNNGGPAFPVTLDHRGCVGAYGMNLRDWFAGQALAGIMTNLELQLEVVKAQIKRKGQEKFLVGQCFARHCFDVADAMIEARNS